MLHHLLLLALRSLQRVPGNTLLVLLNNSLQLVQILRQAAYHS
jgi:hypothetical protein